MRAWHAIDRESLFWDCLKKVRDGAEHPRDFDAMTIDDVLKGMMNASKGQLDPRTTRERLVELDAADGEPEWRRIAFYLAECHAAIALYDGTLKSCSGARRERFLSICRKALEMLRLAKYTGPAMHERRGIDSVREHLESAVRELG